MHSAASQDVESELRWIEVVSHATWSDLDALAGSTEMVDIGGQFDLELWTTLCSS